MKLKLIRTQFRPDGIFGELLDESGARIAVTLEHSYNKLPKLPNGSYTCKLGPHRLHGMSNSFNTYEIENVPGHDNILFHWGNYNRDSEGCVLLGQVVSQSHAGQMVTNSRLTWSKFIALLGNAPAFSLTVE